MICKNCGKEIGGNKTSFENHVKSCLEKNKWRKCENCGKDFFGDWRKYPRGKARYCSIECSKARLQTDEVKKKKSEISKRLWKNKEYLEKMNNRNSGSGRIFTKEERMKGVETQRKKRKEKNKKLIEEGKYEFLSNKVRRKTILEEANYACESCGFDKWLGKKIWLEIHHIDDDNSNNKRENLMVVCPNCHSVLDENYRFRGRSHK